MHLVPSLALIQFGTDIPSRPSLFTNDFPHLLESARVMLPHCTAMQKVWDCHSVQVSHLSPKYCTAVVRLQELDDTLASPDLIFLGEKMQKAPDVDEIKHSFGLTQPSTLVEYVSGEEVRLQHVSVGEKLVTQIDKAVLQVTGVHIFGYGAVADQLA